MNQDPHLRQLPLLQGEEIIQLFVPTEGLVFRPPAKGEFLALTTRRVFAFTSGDGHNEARMVPLEELHGVAVASKGRNSKALYQGLGLVLVGILIYLLLGTFYTDRTVAAFVGVIVALLGFLFMIRYLAGEEGGQITFQGGAWEVAFAYSSKKATLEAYQVAHRFFQLKLDTRSPAEAAISLGSRQASQPSDPAGPDGHPLGGKSL